MRENLFELSRNKALNRYFTIFLKRKIIKKMIKVNNIKNDKNKFLF